MANTTERKSNMARSILPIKDVVRVKLTPKTIKLCKIQGDAAKLIKLPRMKTLGWMQKIPLNSGWSNDLTAQLKLLKTITVTTNNTQFPRA